MKWLCVLIFVVVALTPPPAHAFTISTGFTDACHETIVCMAFESFLVDLPLTTLPVPETEDWRRVANYLMETAGEDPNAYDEAQRFLIVSLLVGVRSPDTEGHSILNLDNARGLHTDPDPVGQYLHALRGVDDDGPEGERVAIEGIRHAIRDSLEQAVAAARRPIAQQTIRAEIYFDFYGPIEIDVWAPAYFVGRAAHTMQDSFSHTVRNESDGFRQIVTIFNYSEAVSGTIEHDRDGIAHSEAMDSCDGRNEPILTAVTRATRDVFVAARELFRGRNPNAGAEVVDQWVTLASDCGPSAGYCGNQHWVDFATSEPTGPVLCAVSVPVGGGSGPWHWLVVAGTLVMLLRRRRA